MNADILGHDLPMSERLKRKNRRGWRLDRRDNIAMVAQATRAYIEVAAPLPWEGTFTANRAHLASAPFGGFDAQSLELYMEAYVLGETMDELDGKPPYPGKGNDQQRLQTALDYLHDTSQLRHEESIMMDIAKKGKLISVVQNAKHRKVENYEQLPNKKIMTEKTYEKADVVRLLAETLHFTPEEVSQHIPT